MTSEDHTQQNDETESYRDVRHIRRAGSAHRRGIAPHDSRPPRLHGSSGARRRANPRLRHPALHRPHRRQQQPRRRLPASRHPLKEALFRLILANGNQPMTADQISETLTQRWAMSAYPRNLTPHVINRILENSANYCIIPLDSPTRTRGNHHRRVDSSCRHNSRRNRPDCVGSSIHHSRMANQKDPIRRRKRSPSSNRSPRSRAQVTSISDLSQIIGQMDLLKELHRNEEWKRAIDRYSSLRRLLTEARVPYPVSLRRRGPSQGFYACYNATAGND